MKKIIAAGLFIAMLFALALPVTAYTEITAPKAIINLDGVRDDAYAGPWDLIHFWDGGLEQTGATGKVWTAWDDDYVYFYFEVHDETPYHDHANDYEQDCVEIYIDWYNAKDDDTSDINHPYWHYRLCSAPNPSKDDWQFFNGVNQAAGEEGTGWQVEEHIESQNANSVVNLTDTGYTIEIRVEYKKFGINVSEGSVIGIDFFVCDNQEDEGRTSGAFLDPDHSTNEQWQWPYEIGGQLTLGAAVAVPVDETPDEPEAAVVDGGGDAAVVVTPPANNTGGAAKTGDSGLVLLVLAIVLAGAFVTVRRVGKNRV